MIHDTSFMIKDIAEVQTGPFGSQLHNKDYVAEGTPIVTVEHLGEKRFSTQNLPCVSDKDKERLSKYSLQKGDIVFSRVGSVDRCSFVSEEETGWLFSGRCLRVRPNSDLCVPEYLYYYLCSPLVKEQIRNIAVGATMPSINTKLLCEIPVSCPDIETQIKIATILSSLDGKIEVNNQINRNLEEQAKAIFKSWFVDFEPFGGKQPDDWKDGTIADLGKVIGGGTPSKAKEEYYCQNGIPWITPKDLSVNKSKFISHGQTDISDAGLNNSSAIIMPKGTVLFSSRAPIGYIAIAKNEVTTNQGFKSVVPHPNVGTPFVYLFLKYNLEKIESVASGSTFKEVSGGVMKSISALIPDNKSLSEFTEQCHALFQKQEALEAENTILQETRDTLLPKLMSGEIDF